MLGEPWHSIGLIALGVIGGMLFVNGMRWRR